MVLPLPAVAFKEAIDKMLRVRIFANFSGKHGDSFALSAALGLGGAEHRRCCGDETSGAPESGDELPASPIGCRSFFHEFIRPRHSQSCQVWLRGGKIETLFQNTHKARKARRGKHPATARPKSKEPVRSIRRPNSFCAGEEKSQAATPVIPVTLP